LEFPKVPQVQVFKIRLLTLLNYCPLISNRQNKMPCMEQFRDGPEEPSILPGSQPNNQIPWRGPRLKETQTPPESRGTAESHPPGERNDDDRKPRVGVRDLGRQSRRGSSSGKPSQGASPRRFLQRGTESLKVPSLSRRTRLIIGVILPEAGPAVEGGKRNDLKTDKTQLVLRPEGMKCDFLRFSNYNRQY
jgi:hypothetical protein